MIVVLVETTVARHAKNVERHRVHREMVGGSVNT
jgi:hypothetical protein